MSFQFLKSGGTFNSLLFCGEKSWNSERLGWAGCWAGWLVGAACAASQASQPSTQAEAKHAIQASQASPSPRQFTAQPDTPRFRLEIEELRVRPSIPYSAVLRTASGASPAQAAEALSKEGTLNSFFFKFFIEQKRCRLLPLSLMPSARIPSSVVLVQ